MLRSFISNAEEVLNWTMTRNKVGLFTDNCADNLLLLLLLLLSRKSQNCNTEVKAFSPEQLFH